ncbi:hypothetical protein Pmi06nite_20310 [Planotetraspora mira]|uniref:Uncharacterized protein n=1 Tax=Planotetraspora mira TaxID=58121 RepID=A0A8J3TQ86_9ACTN|nr:hypothetical protein Pmi06nite_20310 [Planotetraspora mira]
MHGNDVWFYLPGPGAGHGMEIKRDKSKGDKNDAEARDRFIAELGMSGWELVSAAYPHHLDPVVLWFKRPVGE